MEELTEGLRRAYNGLRYVHDDVQRESTLDAVERYRKRLDYLLDQLEAVAPEYVSLRLMRGAQMPAKRVVLAEYFTTQDLTLLFIVRADFGEPKVVEIKTPLDEIRKFVTANFGVADGGSKAHELDLADWQARFAPFVEPILPWADEGDIVWLVPHDMLHYLPLHALKVEGRYLIERNPVCYTPSASVMKYCHAKRKERRDRILVLADSRTERPLLHAREQALAIQQLFEPNAQMYLGDSATKSLVKQRLSESKDDIDVLHFACHGYFHPYQALRSGIMLAPENGDHPSAPEKPEESPWNLTAEDIFGLEMKADLVTLSACESGVNERKPGDELIGLTRALIYAGTPSVLVSLWSVDEISTSILMRKFYEALKVGANKAEALQKAQVALMTMTAQDVTHYCEDAERRLTGPEAPAAHRLLDWDIAKIRFAARDFEGALDAYSRLQREADPDSNSYRQLAVALAQCRSALRNPKPIDYGTHIYARPYHWAPFVLVGDWK